MEQPRQSESPRVSRSSPGVTLPQLPRWATRIDGISRGFMVLGAAAVLALAIHVFADVLVRYSTGRPLPATLEITANWWMPIIAFAGLGYAQLRRDHIRATVLTDSLKGPWSKAANVIDVVALAVGALLLGYAGWLSALDALATGRAVEGAVTVPVWPVTFLVPIGFAVLVLQCASTVASVFVGDEPVAHIAEEVL